MSVSEAPTSQKWCCSRILHFRMEKLILLLFVFVCGGSFPLENEETELKLVFIIFRHSERVPETNEQYPNDEYPISYFHPLTYGDITKEGKQRMFALGQKLKNRYENFVRYSSENVATFSTDWDRTKISALLLLAGMFPPDPSEIWNPQMPWQPIPYVVRDSENDHLLQRPDPYCPRYVKILNKVMKSRQVKNIYRKYDSVFKYVSENSGRFVNNFHDALRIYQNLHSKNLMNLTVPEWAKSVYPEPLATIGSFQCVFENYNKALIRLNGGHILQKIIDLSKKKIENRLTPQGRKLYLFSGHENNIVNILATLKLYKQHIPPYSSAVILELHKRKDCDQYSFKVLYENSTYTPETHELVIPECEALCPFNTFLKLTRPFVPLNYTAECESSTNLDDYPL